jgi:hypothetical protein
VEVVMRVKIAVAGAMAWGLLAAPLAAQARPLTITGARGITFGAVLPGVPVVALRTDPVMSGEFDIRGPNRGTVLLTFTLPAQMDGPAGAQLPLLFGGGDAGYSAARVITSQVGFDPKQPYTAALPNNGRAAVFIGGTAAAAANQRAGPYTATVTLTVTVLP